MNQWSRSIATHVGWAAWGWAAWLRTRLVAISNHLAINHMKANMAQVSARFYNDKVYGAYAGWVAWGLEARAGLWCSINMRRKRQRYYCLRKHLNQYLNIVSITHY